MAQCFSSEEMLKEFGLIAPGWMTTSDTVPPDYYGLHCFQKDGGWLKPKNMKQFTRTDAPTVRNNLKFKEMNCCGAVDVHGIQDDRIFIKAVANPDAELREITGEDFVRQIILSRHAHTFNTKRAFYLFFENKAQKTPGDDVSIGARIGHYIQERELGDVLVSPWNYNGNSGRYVRMFTLMPSQKMWSLESRTEKNETELGPVS